MATDKERIDKLEQDVKALTSAFLKEEDGSPDFPGHRLYHRRRDEEEKDSKKKRSDVTTNLITWAVAGILTLVFTLMAHNWSALAPLIGK